MKSIINAILKPSKKAAAPSGAVVMSLIPYRYHGMWVFDHEPTNARAEAFVCGMSEIIDQMLIDSGIDPHTVRDGFRLTFSGVAFPNHTHSLTWQRPEAGGNIYVCDQNKMGGWLCPALLWFFDKAPKKLYSRVDLIDRQDLPQQSEEEWDKNWEEQYL